MSDTPKEILQKQFDIIKAIPLNKRVNDLFEMTELSRQIIQNRIFARNPGLSEIDLKIELFKTFYRFDFDQETIDLIADSMQQTLKNRFFMSNKDIRWIQRFRNFEKAFLRLKEAMDIEKLNELERDGLIQRFEFTLDLSWKAMKDYLEEKGFSFKPSPKDTFRLAQENSFINYAQALIDGLDIRNELSHDYDGEKFEKYEEQLRKDTFPALAQLHAFFTQESGQKKAGSADA